MERDPFTDEGIQDAYLQHAIQRRLSRPSSLPVFHIGPRPNLYSPFPVPYYNEGKYQNDIFKQQNRQTELMTSDPLLVPQPRTVQNTQQDGSSKFSSPQFAGKLRHDVGFGFQHSPFMEPKPFVNERDVNDYSPFPLKCSPLFPYDIPFPYEERQPLSYAKEAHSSHAFSPGANFAHQLSPFAFEKRQSQFHPSPIDLKLQGNSERNGNKSGGRHLDRSDFHDESYVVLNNQRQESLQRDLPPNPRDNADFRDSGVMSSQDCQLQKQHLLSVDRQRGGLSSHELNQTRKSVICISSKEAGTSAHSNDLQISPNEPKVHAKSNVPNSVLDSLSVDRTMGIGKIDKKHMYLIQSPSKYSAPSMDTFHSPSNLFESIFNIGDSRDQGSFPQSMEEAIKTGCNLLENGGYNLKAFREEFLVNNGEKEDLVGEAFSKIGSSSSRETKLQHSIGSEAGINSPTVNLRNKGLNKIDVNIPQFVGEYVNGNTKKSQEEHSSERDSSMHNAASSDGMLNRADGTVTEHNVDCMKTGKKCPFNTKNSLQNGSRKEEPITEVLTKADVGKRKDTSKEIIHQNYNGELEKEKRPRENHCIVEQSKEIDSSFVDHGEEEGGENNKECKEGNSGEIGSLSITEGEQQNKTAGTHRDNLSSEDTSEDTVRKRTLSREERAIQYAVEKFKEMEEKKLMAITGKRRGKGKRESKDQSTENSQNGEHDGMQNVDSLTRQNTEVESEAQNTATNRKRKKTVNFEIKDVEEEEHSIIAKKSKVNKSKSDISMHPKFVRKDICTSKGLRRGSDSLGEKPPRTKEREEKLDKKQHKSSASLQDSSNEKDILSRSRNDMQQKSYLLVPSYRGFKDFSPVVLEGRTRQRSTQSDAVKVGKQRFPILVVETVGEKQNKILVNENEDLDAKVAKESLLAEGVFEHQDEVEDGKALSTAKRLSCNRTTGETILHKAARLGYDDVVDIKIKAGADVNAKDNAGWTALHEACLRGKANVVRVLLTYGADPNSRSESGIRPLHDAIDSNNIDIIRLLLSYGADISLETYSGVKSFQLARSTQVKEFLKGYIGDIKEPALLENLGDYTEERWHFRGTSSFLDGATDDAREIFKDFPAASDLQIEFVASTKEPLPIYNLPVFEDDSVTGFRNYYILDDVLSCLSITRSTFLKKHKVELRVVRLDEMLHYINQSQIASLPDSFMSSDPTDETLIELVHIGHYTARRLFDLKIYQV